MAHPFTSLVYIALPVELGNASKGLESHQPRSNLCFRFPEELEAAGVTGSCRI